MDGDTGSWVVTLYRVVVAAVARKAHNLEVVSSILTHATKKVLKKFDSLKMTSYLCKTIERKSFSQSSIVL